MRGCTNKWSVAKKTRIMVKRERADANLETGLRLAENLVKARAEVERLEKSLKERRRINLETEAERDRYREALERIANGTQPGVDLPCEFGPLEVNEIAREALEGK